MLNVTVEMFTAAMEQAVALMGEDYVYVNPDGRKASWAPPVRCYNYDEKGNPSCLIGHALMSLGVTVDDMKYNRTAGASSTMGDLERAGNYLFDHGISSAALAAQQAQDNGKTWGEALTVYKQTIAMYGV